MFFKCSLCILICECTSLFLSFIVFVNFSNVHWFWIKIKVSDWVERNFFSLTVLRGNLLAGDVHSNVTMDRHVHAWEWIDNICLLTWYLLWASAYLLEVWSHIAHWGIKIPPMLPPSKTQLPSFLPTPPPPSPLTLQAVQAPPSFLGNYPLSIGFLWTLP